MDQRPIAALELCQRINAASLLVNVGQPLPDEAIKSLSNWTQALRARKRHGWENYLIDRRNEFGLNIQEISIDRYNQWNTHVNFCTPLIQDHIQRAARQIPNTLDVKPIHADTLKCLRLAVIEQCYSDIVPPDFFTRLSEWFFKGHYACGWIGRYPEGKCVVY